MVSVACFRVRVSAMFHLMFVHNILRFGMLSSHRLGNSCPLGWSYVLIVFCLILFFIHFPFWFESIILLLITPISFLLLMNFGVVLDRSEYLVCTRCISNKT